MSNQEYELRAVPTISSDTPLEEEQLLQPQEAQKSDIFAASYNGDVETLKKLIADAPTCLNQVNNANRSPLHLIASGGSTTCKKAAELILHNTTAPKELINLKDNQGKTALHFAVESVQSSLVLLLLKNGSLPDITDAQGQSPLHYLAKCNSSLAIRCAENLLNYNPNLLLQRSKMGSVLHLAARSSAPKMLQFLLYQSSFHTEGGIDLENDNFDYSPLHLSVLSGDSEDAIQCTQQLLDYVSPKVVNKKSGYAEMNTALHFAAANGYIGQFKVLVQHEKINVFVTNKLEKTCLHTLADCYHNSDVISCIKLVLDNRNLKPPAERRFMAKRDGEKNQGDTALQIAIRNRSLLIVKYLLDFHSQPSVLLDDQTLEAVYEKVPDSLIPLLDKALTFQPSSDGNINEIDVNFGCITGYSMETEDQETKYVQKLLTADKDQKKMFLLHPVVQIFLDKKIERFRKLSIFWFILRLIWLLLYTTLFYELFPSDCPVESTSTDNGTNTESDIKTDSTNPVSLRILFSLGFSQNNNTRLNGCDFNRPAAIGIAIVLYLYFLTFLVKEILIAKVYEWKYNWSLLNCTQCTFQLIILINTITAFQAVNSIQPWQYNLASVGICLAWFLFMVELAKFPYWGHCWPILLKVLPTFLKMFVFYIPAFVGPALALSRFVKKSGLYKYPLFGIFNNLMMLTGEVDYRETFFDEETGPDLSFYAIIGQICIFGLTLLALVVSFVLAALAIQDIFELMREAKFVIASMKLEQVSFFDSIIQWIDSHTEPSLQKYLNLRENYYLTYDSKQDNFQRTVTLDTRGIRKELMTEVRVIARPSSNNASVG